MTTFAAEKMPSKKRKVLGKGEKMILEYCVL